MKRYVCLATLYVSLLLASIPADAQQNRQTNRRRVDLTGCPIENDHIERA